MESFDTEDCLLQPWRWKFHLSFTWFVDVSLGGFRGYNVHRHTYFNLIKQVLLVQILQTLCTCCEKTNTTIAQ